MSGDLRQDAVIHAEFTDILIMHQRVDIGHCLCGWGVDAGNIGQSHACHVTDLLLPIISRCIAQARAETAEQERLYDAWVVIANVSGGDWSQQTPEWQEAAERWRDSWHDSLGYARIARQHAEDVGSDE